MVGVSVGNQGLWVKCKLSSCHRRKLFVDLSDLGLVFCFVFLLDDGFRAGEGGLILLGGLC